MVRYRATTADLDRAEQQWWEDHGDLEEDFCWVQNPRQQQALRRGYLRSIARSVDTGGSLLEIGCGTGWVALLLAAAGLPDVVGVDFSPSQVKRARDRAVELGLADRVRFALVSDGDTSIAGRRYDSVVMHAFLHHLSTEEVEEALREADDRLAPGGTLVVLEPLHYADGPAPGPWSLRATRRLANLPVGLVRLRLRRTSQRENEVRRRMDTRHVGLPPFGPSPKETPFAPGELDELLSHRFEVVSRWPALCASHLVAQEFLIAALSQPRLWRVLEVPALRLARLLDRATLRARDLPSTVWIFQLYVCAKKPS